MEPAGCSPGRFSFSAEAEPLLSGQVQKRLLLSAPRTPPTLALPLKGGGNYAFIAASYTSPLEGEVGAQRREGGVA